MSHIVIDARKYFDYGIGTYLQELTSQLAQQDTQHTYSLIAGSEARTQSLGPEQWRKSFVPYRKYSLSELLFLGGHARRTLRADLLHIPHYTLPLFCEGRSVVTIHDLIQLKFPQYFNALKRGYARGVISHAVRNAGAVIAVSQTTKNDLLDMFSVDEARIHVVHNGVSSVYSVENDTARIDHFLNDANVFRPYLLYVGSLKPHKNIGLLLDSFARLHQADPQLQLVMAGERLEQYPRLLDRAKSLGVWNAIRELRTLSRNELRLLYNGAALLVMPSQYEGFGLPPLEAMACGTPVVSSAGGSLPEIVGDAAIVVAEPSPDDWARAIDDVRKDEGLQRKMREKGLRRAAAFSWVRCASMTLQVYRQVLAATGR
ncbi:MAG: glycosyltransferase family 4 protein [Ignavibacteria bacterium]|nr:glycosyltransferase family 4 protein [Ignavibacteria bacterium]